MHFQQDLKTRIKEPNTWSKKDDKGVTILECPEENCICTFEKMEALNTHLLGQLLSSKDTHILDSKSTMRLYFAEYNILLSKRVSSEALQLPHLQFKLSQPLVILEMCQMLNARDGSCHIKKPVCLTEKQKKWLTDMFVEGGRTRKRKPQIKWLIL